MKEQKEYSVKQVANLSGVSVRTLHYYEEIGLLAPRRGSNNYRIYSLADIRTLQQIMLFRSCGMELSTIKTVLKQPGYSALESLRNHLHTLTLQSSELQTRIETVTKTIQELEGEYVMKDSEYFEGLKQKTIQENEQAYGKEIRQRYGNEVVDVANEKLLSKTKGEWVDAQKLEGKIIEQLKRAMVLGDTKSTEAKTLCSLHKQWLIAHWPEGMYSKEAHTGLAQGYLADQRFVDYYDSRAGEGATQFLVDALIEYCTGQ